MKITYGGVDITPFILEYQRKADVTTNNLHLLGNTPAYELDIKIDNNNHVIDHLEKVIKEYNDDGVLKGTYYVYDAPERYTNIVSITCFDTMLLLNTAYHSKLVYPATIQEQMQEIATQCNVSINANDLPSSIRSQVVNSWDNTIACRNYVGWAAEIAGMNAYASQDGTIRFKELSKTPRWNTNDIEDYDKDEVFNVSRICLENGVLFLREGDETGNTLYLTPDNFYIDTAHDPTLYLYNKYKGFTFTSVSDMRAAGLQDVMLFDVIEYDDFRMLCLSLTDTYKGGTYAIQDIDGVLPSKKAEAVTVRYDENIRIKKIEVNLDNNEQKLEIVAKEQEHTNEQISSMVLDLEGIHQSVSKIENIEETQRYKVVINSSKMFFRKKGENAVVTATVTDWGKDITDQIDETYFHWTRMSKNPEKDVTWNEAYGHAKKSIVISTEDVMEHCIFNCEVMWDVIEKNNGIKGGFV